MRQFVRRQRPSDAWFDKDCRAAKRLTRRLERVYSAATASASCDAADAVAKATRPRRLGSINVMSTTSWSVGSV